MVDNTEVVEKRLRPTLIRRRAQAKPEEVIPETPPGAPVAAAADASQVTPEKPKGAQPPTIEPFKPRITFPNQEKAAADAAKKPETKDGAPATTTTTTVAGVTVVKDLVIPEDFDAKFKKNLKAKKKSRAEMEMEEIMRVGGLKSFAQTVVKEGEVLPTERVFEPGPRRNRRYSPAAVKRPGAKTAITTMKASKRKIKIEKGISVTEFSQAMGVKSTELIKKLIALGIMATVNQTIDVDTAVLLAADYDFEIERVAFDENKMMVEGAKAAKMTEATEAGKVQRWPVVTVMGHVDHGKTSLLDAIRQAKVADGEAGGITQHIGAYIVETVKGKVCFIDTPGHEAFTAMRARGSKVTDIVVLVVAADDGVMPQTIESINHARAAGVPIIVAINKIDKPEANMERVKSSLSEQGILLEDWGGDILSVPTSARQKTGITELLDTILLQSEILELKGDPTLPAKGTIIEAKLDKGMGAVATLLVQEGTLKIGTPVVCGLCSGRVRILRDFKGNMIESAGPSTPVELIGLSGVPLAGDVLVEVASERIARDISEDRQKKERQNKLAGEQKVTLENFAAHLAGDGGLKTLNLIVKTDVHGSSEAIKESLVKLTGEKVKVEVLQSGVGGVTENDVMLASASNAVIIGFNVVPDGAARRLAEQEKVEIKKYSIIYELIDDVKKSMEGLLEPNKVEKLLGHAEVRTIFKISKIGTVAGCKVMDGKIVRSASVRVLRDSVIVHTGKLSSLKRFKDDAREVENGLECGMSIDNYNDLKEGDVLEAFIIEEIAQKL